MVFGFLKRRILPREHRPPLSRDERVLAWAFTSGGVPARGRDTAGPEPDSRRNGGETGAAQNSGDPIVATNLGLWVRGTRTDWHDIAKAVWDGSVLSVIVSSPVVARDGYVVVADAEPVRYPVSEPGHLPHQVRLRVTNSVRNASHHGLPGGGGVWIAARRVPGKDGLSWIVRYDAGTDADDPAVTLATDEIFRETHWRTVGGSE